VLGSPAHALSVDSVTPAISSSEAVAAVLRNVRSQLVPGRVAGGPSGATRQTVFENGDRASLVLFVEGATTRLAWDTRVTKSSTESYHAVVDAGTGRVLYRQNMVKFADAHGSVWENHPGTGILGNTQADQNLTTLGFIPADATDLTGGTYANAWSDINDNDANDPGENITPATGNDFTHTYVPVGPSATTAPRCDPKAPCGWNSTVPTSWTGNREQNGVQDFYFVSKFAQHLDDDLGFGAAAGNFLAAGGDPVLVQNDDGASKLAGGPDLDHLDNANMNTFPDGTSPIMQMYLFTYNLAINSPFRDINGGDDAAIVYHELTHGLSNRLITFPDGNGAVGSPQAGAMGEGWSDWYAKDYLVQQGNAVNTGADGEVNMGEFTDAVPNQIRTQALDCKVGSTVPECPGLGVGDTGGYTYGDFGHILSGPEVHADGEVWAETLWDLRSQLGSGLTGQLVTEAMVLSPVEPSFLDERNAILLADQNLSTGANAGDIWAVFAHRGMGFYAGAVDGLDASPVEDFNLPPAPGGPTGSVAGTITDADSGLPVNGVDVGVGGFLRNAPLGFDPLVGTTDANGHYTVGSIPVGDYGKLAVVAGAGFDAVEFPATITDGGTVTHDAALRRDWAAFSGGADVVGTNADTYDSYGCGAHALIDQTQGAGWSADNPLKPAPDPSDPYVTIELPQAIDVTKFLADPGNACGDGASAATKGYKIETSPDGTTWTVAKAGTFGSGAAGNLNEVLPTAGATGVKFVKLTLQSAQDESAGLHGHDYVDFSELEVLGHSPNVLPSGSLASDKDSVDQGGSVHFTASFTDPDSKITGYGWDFDGNGTTDQTTTAPAVDHSFTDAGTPSVTVLAGDFRGGSGSASKAIEVKATPPPPPPPPPPAASPKLKFGKAGKGKVTVTITCASACTAKGAVKVTSALRRKLRLKSVTLGSRKLTLKTAGTKTLTVKVTKKASTAARRRKVKRVKLTLSVSVKDSAGKTATLKKAIKLKL
jgi:hypothetical protein